MPDLHQLERIYRSRILGSPFVLTNLLTRFEIFGRERLLEALARRRASGRGLITISNHQSLFDDPLVIMAILGLRDFTVQTKCWWSTPCQSNFCPEGKSAKARFVRYFSDVSNMVFLARSSKKGKNGQTPGPSSFLETLVRAGKTDLVDLIMDRAASMGTGGESYLRRFVTPGDGEELAPLNQMGMVEACARIDLGDWMHFFPEGGRSRSLALCSPKKGVGKILFHCDQAEVLPICFCGMQDVLPVKATLPRPLKRVVVLVGEPIPSRHLQPLRRGPATPELFQELARVTWEPVQSLWQVALARYRKESMLVSPLKALPHLLDWRIWQRQARLEARTQVPLVPPQPVRADEAPASSTS